MNMSILAALPGFALAFILIFCYEYRIKLIKTKLKNKVHFYIARDMDGRLFLYIGKPIRVGNLFSPTPMEGIIALGSGCNLKWYGLNENDYDNLKWEDEPVEVFVNMKD